jgi:glutamate-1-semialdehyde 2,1-aminomutase
MTTTQAVFQELCRYFPGGVNSPVRSAKAVDDYPLIAASAKGSRIIDVEGNSYLDFCMSWGPLIHGHAHPKILQRIQEQMVLGTTYGVTTEIEGKLARKICQLMPGIDKIRFVSSGTEAAMSAVRLARGVTSRPLIVKFSGHYHGHADFFLVQAGSGVLHLNPESSSKGIPKELVQHTLCLPFNDRDAFEKICKVGNNIAAVIVEPVAGNMGIVPPEEGFLQFLRQKCSQIGALLIFDEVITGFRLGKGGAQELYKVEPDLTCLGKIVGGGLPAAAFGGKKKWMEHLAPLGEVYQAGTLSGNPLAMAAGLASLEILEEPGFYEKLQAKADLFLAPIKKRIQEKKLNACIQQVGSLFTLFLGVTSVSSLEDAKKCDGKKYGELFRFLRARGIYIPPLQQEAWFISTAHSDQELEEAAGAIFEFLSV